MSMTLYDNPRLLADIGGTYARFTLEVAPGVFEHSVSLRCADHVDFHAAVTAYLAGLSGTSFADIKNAAVAIANPVSGDEVRMTNYHWQFSIEQMRERLQLDNLVVVNDFTALAMALPSLLPHQRRQIGGGTALSRSVVGLIGAGSGLGVSGLIPANDGWVALGTEGGHTSFSPRDERELAILQYAWRYHPHVSFERLVSGPGIELIYRALAERAGRGGEALSAPDITQRAIDRSDPVCVEVIDAFCAMLGTAAANLAVTQGAFGGIYIGGGIVPRLGSYFDSSIFRQRFEDKGRFTNYMKGIPTFVITAVDATLLGASVILAAQLRSLDSAQGSAILSQIHRARNNLSPAEQRVADHILAHPRSTLNDPIAQIARAAEVSQPTVIRFCRSLGCEGLSDFKLRLASGLTGTMPITHTQVTGEDSMLELGVKVLGNTASAILQVRDHLNRETIDRAIQLISAAQRVEFYAVGHYSVVADDAQFKFLRMGVSSVSYTAPRLQVLAAKLLRPEVVAVVISSSGRVDELLDVVEKAHERGATVIAITASQSPLARKADLALIVDHVEDTATQVPMISRILHLLMIDILVVGVSLRRGAHNLPLLGNAATAALDETRPTTPATRGSSPGVSAAGALAHLTSHSR
ncbi:MAG: glucokinase [Rhodoferax sp.]|uniref:glucokinase n=1 Tax=Rhodoferax sp. TaxID=50421 RepID=UPI00261F9D80|nr:glucokinase [Rhodoferax sp.]MDD5336330.1 glucokinase [Rhodoferax sp.]